MSTVTNFFLVVESSSWNFLSKFREGETEPEFIEGEFPRALNLMRLVQQPTKLSTKKFSDKKIYGSNQRNQKKN